MTESIAAFIMIHSLWTFLVMCMAFLLDQPGKTIWFSVNHCPLGPVDRAILLVRVVSKKGIC